MAETLPQVSVILLTYQWPRALDRVLESLAAQSELPLEVIVADDGSGPETKAVVDDWQIRAPFPLSHSWHPDQGFRAAEARNLAAARAAGELLLFLDGDCLLFDDFIARHRRLAEPGWMLVGNRLLLDQRLSEAVLAGEEHPPRWGWSRWLGARLSGRVNRLLPLIRLGDGDWRRRSPKRWRGAQSCNLAIWRDDFYAVNGFDERYQGWGHEDADLVVRLMSLGIGRKDGRNAVPVLHLWHPHQDRTLEAENVRRLEAALAGETTPVVPRGVRQHMERNRNTGYE